MKTGGELVGALGALVNAGIVAVDADGTVTACDPVAADRLGVAVGAPAGPAVAAVAARLGGAEGPEWQGSWEGELAWGAAGAQVPAWVRAVPLPGDGGTVDGALFLLVASPDADSEESRIARDQAVALVASLQRAAPMGHILFDVTGRYLRVNDAMVRMNGGTREERIGRNVAEVQPGLAAPVLAALEQVVASGQALQRQRIEGETRARPGDRRVWRMTYYPVTSPSGRLIGVGAICEDVTEVERSARHVDIVGKATAALLRAVTVDQVLRIALVTVVEWLGAATAGAIVRDPSSYDARLARLAPQGAGTEAAIDWSAVSVELEAFAADAAGEGAPTVIDLGVAGALLPGVVDAAGNGVVVLLPLITVPGALCALALGYPGRRIFGAHERALFAAVADQCAVALDRARSLERAEAAASLTARLQQVTARLARAMSEEQIASVVLDEARTGLRASGGGLGLVDQEQGLHRFVATFGWDRRVMGPLLDDRTLDEPGLAADAVRRGAPVYVTSPADLDRYLPAGPAERRGEWDRHQSWVALPLVGGTGAIGSLAFSFPTVRRFNDQERSFLASVAGQATAAIERVRRYQAEHQIAAVLQRALLPERLPSVSGLAVAVRYLSGAEGTQVGGDWYDVFLLEGGEVALVIGDVAGHDLVAAGTMGHLRAQLRACARSGLDPGLTLNQLDRLVHRASTDVERFATLVYAVWEPGSPTVELAVAGHPPPLLVDPAGARFVDSPTGPPIGAGVEPAEYVTQAVELDRSATTMLVLYTDGLVERPEWHLADSLDQLQSQGAAVVHPDPHDLADYLIGRLRPTSGWTDDVALLVCRFAVPG